MTHFPHGAFIAAHAARERRRRDEQEEEEMTNYTSEDLDNNWEFKIVRSESGAFRKPDVFQNLLQEEQIAGWELVEKLDDRRVRLKRRKEARRKDTMLPQGYDPYRTKYGSSLARTSILLGIVFAIMLLVGLAVFGATSGEASKTATIFPVLIITGVIAMLVGVISFARRQ